jgi:hypothetical protein
MQQKNEKTKIERNLRRLAGIISLSVVFGVSGFLYSFFGLFEQTRNVVPLEPFRLLTIQEIGGHFLFGFIVSLPLKNLKIAILTGLMALTIDSDHLLNFSGLHIQGRIDHSIAFAIISSIIMGFIAAKVYFKISRENNISLVSSSFQSSLISQRSKKTEERKRNNIFSILSKAGSSNKHPFFMFFLVMTLSAFLSHIAYDVFVDDKAKFPLLAPFSFNEFVIPRTYGLLIEAIGMLILYFGHIGYYNNNGAIFRSK